MSVDGIAVLRDPTAVKQRIAVVRQRPNLDRSIPARENLTFHAAYFGSSRAERAKRADEMLVQFGLEAGVEKVVFASLRAVIAALLIFPLAVVVLPAGVDFGAISYLPLAALLVGGSVAGAAGLTATTRRSCAREDVSLHARAAARPRSRRRQPRPRGLAG